MAEPELEKQELLEKVYWVITLRNIAVGVAVILGVAGALAAQAFAPLVLGLLLAGLVLTYNLAGQFILKRKEAILDANEIIKICFAQLLADIVIVTLLVHITGGILSPFTLMYLFSIVIISMVAPENPLLARSLAMLVILLYEVLLFLELFELIPPVAIIHDGREIYQNIGLYLYHFFVFPTFAIIAVFLSSNMTVLLTKGKTVLKQRIGELNRIRKTLEEALLELERKTSEISVLYEIAIKGVLPLSNFTPRLAEIMGAETVEILSSENQVLARHGFPAPGTPKITLEVPLRYQDKNIGLIKLSRFTGKEFNGEDKRVLTMIADQLADALEHQRMEQERLILEEQLKAKVKELEDFHDLAVGRELKMMELEKEVNALLKELGREPRYK